MFDLHPNKNGGMTPTSPRAIECLVTMYLRRFLVTRAGQIFCFPLSQTETTSPRERETQSEGLETAERPQERERESERERVGRESREGRAIIIPLCPRAGGARVRPLRPAGDFNGPPKSPDRVSRVTSEHIPIYVHTRSRTRR